MELLDTAVLADEIEELLDAAAVVEEEEDVLKGFEEEEQGDALDCTVLSDTELPEQVGVTTSSGPQFIGLHPGRAGSPPCVPRTFSLVSKVPAHVHDPAAS